MRLLFLLVIIAVSCITVHGQTDTVRVNGQVHSGSEPVEYAIVAMLQPSDSSIIAYAMTDDKGFYSLNAITALDTVLMKVTGFNIKHKVQYIETRSQSLNFNVEKETIMLHEVKVKAQKLWGSRDTLNYLVSAYTRDHDRTIGDVLRQLPGITVDDNGEIKYQGIPINHFYIENLDMLEGRYNLATEGINAEDVATVQVLENHEHVRALQDQKVQERAAINLKLKDKSKDVWTESVNIGAGGNADGMLWDATLQAMCFGKSGQHMLRYNGDNMGHGSDAATIHYGSISNNSPSLTCIVGHGVPPVGNSTFGYVHSINLNNLAKLSDSATVNYNFNYSHNYTHGNSFSRTTYILPDGSKRLLTEDVADQLHTNSADIQLTYEKNTEQRFVNNTLTLYGKWREGRGEIASSNQHSISSINESSILQASHYRSLGVSDRVNIVRRTEKGRGFELISANSFSSSPQALAIGGDMTARQDVYITSLSTNNSVEFLQNIRAHHWTLSTKAFLNANYTALTSVLVHPEAQVSPHGDMDYVRTEVGVGPVMRFVKGSFQFTLRVPLSLTYTDLDNASISAEKTSTHRLRMHIQPSLSLLWKATDNFTFNASANYEDRETPWDNLLTATVMQNYHSLTRYRARLNDSYSAGTNVRVTYKNIYKSLFAHLEGKWKRSWSDIAYGSTLDSQAHTVIEVENMPNHSNHYSLTAYGRKDIDWHTMKIELSATVSHSKNEMLRQSMLTTYSSTGYILYGTLAFDIIKGYGIDYSMTWQRIHSTSFGYENSYKEFAQRAQLNMRLLPSRLFLNASISHTHNGSLVSDKKDYVFIGGGLQFKLSKKLEFDLNGDNLTNIHTYKTHSFGDMEEYYNEYHLRPLSVTLTAKINF